MRVEEMGDRELAGMLESQRLNQKTVDTLRRLGYLDEIPGQLEATKHWPSIADIEGEMSYRVALHELSLHVGFKPGLKVSYDTAMRGWPAATAAEPKRGQVGTVTQYNRHGDKLRKNDVPPGYTAVLYSGSDLGYLDCEDTVYFMPNYTLKVVDNG